MWRIVELTRLEALVRYLRQDLVGLGDLEDGLLEEGNLGDLGEDRLAEDSHHYDLEEGLDALEEGRLVEDSHHPGLEEDRLGDLEEGPLVVGNHRLGLEEGLDVLEEDRLVEDSHHYDLEEGLDVLEEGRLGEDSRRRVLEGDLLEEDSRLVVGIHLGDLEEGLLAVDIRLGDLEEEHLEGRNLDLGVGLGDKLGLEEGLVVGSRKPDEVGIAVEGDTVVVEEVVEKLAVADEGKGEKQPRRQRRGEPLAGDWSSLVLQKLPLQGRSVSEK